MKRVRESGETSPVRVPAQGAHTPTQSQQPGAVQAVSRQTQETLAAAPDSARALSATSEPELQAWVQPNAQSGLPKELWEHILGGLDDLALRRVMQTCRTLYLWGRDLPVDEQSRESRVQRAKSYEHLQSILLGYAVSECRKGNCKAELPYFAGSFATALTRYAGRYRSLKLTVHPGFEETVLKALLEGQRWKMAILHFHGQADHALIGRLEAGLLQQKRRCRVGLGSENPARLEGFMPTGSALDLNSLRLERVKPEALGPIGNFLKSQNGLRRLSLLCDDSPADFLPWLEEGTHALTELHLDDFPKADQIRSLIGALQKKPHLGAFGLANGTFREDGLRLSALLDAAPKLDSLLLRRVKIAPGASAGCAQALGKSLLRVLIIDECSLLACRDDSALNDEQRKALKAAEHHELLAGLKSAPCLTELHVGAATTALEVDHFVRAFAANPAARMVRHETMPAPALLQTLVNEANTLRQSNRQTPLKLESMASA